MALCAIRESSGFTPALSLTSRTPTKGTRTHFHVASQYHTPAVQPSALFTTPKREESSISTTSRKRKLQPEPVLWKHVKPAALAAMVALSALSMSLPASAAMSGGRMGGSFSAPSRSMAPSRSYSGGYSRSYSPRPYSGGYGYSPRSSTTIIAPVSPFVTPYSPFYTPPVIYGGGVGVLPVSRGFSPFNFLLLGGAGFLFINSLLNRPMETSWSETDTYGSALGAGTSVLSLSVSVDVSNRDDPNSLLSVLARLAKSADTRDRKGVQNLTSQVALEVLRRKTSIQAASSNYQHYRDISKAERQFNQWSVEQRSKFEQENSSVFSGIDRSTKRIRQSVGDGNATMAVVTFVLAIQGDSTKVPKILSLKNVEEALRKIATDSKVDDCLLSAEILWTPEDRSETLTREKVIADYPELIDV